MGDRPAEDHDELLNRAKEIEGARAVIAQLEAENEMLRRRTGDVASARRADERLRGNPERATGTAYRGEDQLLRLERELAEANVTVANLSIENAILRSRAEPDRTSRARRARSAATVIGIVAAEVSIWVLTRNFGLVLMGALLLGLGWGIVMFSAAIKPDETNPRRPPNLPGGPST
jgi:hypothetical protein